MGGKIVRTIGIAGARFKIGMMTSATTSVGWFSSSGWRLRPLERAHGWRPCVVQKAQFGGPPWHERRNRSLSQGGPNHWARIPAKFSLPRDGP